MKKALFILFLLVTSTLAVAQNKPKKEKVYPMVVVRHTLEWYQEQLTLWEEEVNANPKSPDAWLNAFTAMRMVKIHKGPKTMADLDALVERMKPNIPNTYEYYFILSVQASEKFRNTPLEKANEEAEKNMIKAYEIDPNRTETYSPLLGIYEFQQNAEKLKEVATRYFDLNVMSPGLLSWGYNALVSCELNSVLIVEGDNDTFCALIWQYAKNVRTDVVILNPYVMFNFPETRKKYFAKLGIPDCAITSKTFDGKVVQQLCNHIRKHSNRPFYYSAVVMCNPDWYADIKDSVYWVGFAGKYSPERFDNIAALKKNFEKKYLLDYIKVPVTNDLSASLVNEFNSIVLAPFITLYFHYIESGEKDKSEELLEYIHVISERSEITEEVNKILKEGKI